MSIDDGDYPAILRQTADRWPDRVGLRFEASAWTYAQLDGAVESAVARLASAGIRSGMRVALLLENCPEYLCAQFALARLGAVFVTPNPYWTDPEVAHALQVSATDAAVHSERFAAIAAELGSALEATTLMRPATAPHVAPADPQAPVFIPFSSGTTGLPKGVVHTVASLSGGVRQLCHHLALTTADRIQVALPLCHIFGTTMCAAAMAVGAEVTLFRRFDLNESLRHLIDARVTVWPMSGTVAHQLVDRDDLSPAQFASLRYFMWGGSAVPIGLAERVTALAGGVPFLCSYGMTEAMAVAFNPVERPADWRLDSPGYATEGTQLRLGDNAELLVRGPSVASEYAGADSSDVFLPDGWLRTGDAARIDDDGRLWILDRLKDMIKVSGFQVAPIEVEQALMTHPAVEDAAITAKPNARRGEVPVAFVVARAPVTSGELTEHLRSRLASYKRPAEYRFVKTLPRSAAGKLQRARLIVS